MADNAPDVEKKFEELHGLLKELSLQIAALNPSAEDRLDQFLRNQKSSPYYSLISVLFAVILSMVATWLGVIVTLLSAAPSGPVNNLASQIARQFKLTDAQSLAINSLIQFLTVRGSNDDPRMQLALAFLAFIFVVYLWLYFSRIFIFLPETPRGEFLTFLLGFVILTCVVAAPIMWMQWPFLMAACTLMVSLKACVAWLELCYGTDRENKTHPFIINLRNWAGYSLFYFSLLIGLGFMLRTKDLTSHGWAIWILAIIALVLVIGRFRKTEREIQQEMKKYVNSGNYQEQLLVSP